MREDAYYEQKCKVCHTVADDRYLDELHYINLNPLTPDQYYDTLFTFKEMKPFKAPKKTLANRDDGISLGLRIKSLFNSEAGTVSSE